MSIFEHRKPPDTTPARDQVQVLRKALAALESEAEPTPRIADLKRILANRIAELENQQRVIR